MKRASIFIKFLIVPFVFQVCAGVCSASEDSGTDTGDDGAQKAEYIFYRANGMYEEARYDEAIAEYGRLLDRDLESGNLYYNLGNCYFKKGEPGRALLNYERAMRLIPRDGDLRSNYRYAGSLVKNPVYPARRIWPVRLIEKIFSGLTVNETVVVVSAAYLFTVAAIITGIFLRRAKRFFVGVFVITLAVILAGTFSVRRMTAAADGEAVVIVDTAESRFEPLEHSTAHFLLHEGMKVIILESRKEWYKVRRADGRTAWVKSAALEKI